MIGRITTPLEVPNDQAWNSEAIRLWKNGAAMTVVSAEGWLRKQEEGAPKIPLGLTPEGNEIAIDMSESAMAAIAAGTYAMEVKFVDDLGTTRQARGAVLIRDTV